MAGAAEEPKGEPFLAIVGGDVYTITSGVIRQGTVLIKGGKIFRVGEDLPIPPGATVIPARGKYVLPGFIAVEAQGSWVGNVGKGDRLADSLDPFAQSVSLALAAGITTVGVSLGSGDADRPIGLQTAILKMTEGSLEDMLVREPAFVDLNYSGASLVGRAYLKQQLRRAQQYLRARTEYEREKAAGRKAAEPPQPPDVADLLPLLRRELPARIRATRAAEILAALELVDEFNLRLVLAFPVEGWTVAEEISRRNVSAIITLREKLRPDEDISAPSGSTIELAKILRQAGVKFAILPPDRGFSTGGTAGRDLLTLPLEAAFAVRGGLDEETALQAITLHAAEILGIEDRVGSIQEGKDADLILLDGHPFDYKTFVETTIVQGRVLYEKDKRPYFSHLKRPESAESEQMKQPEEADGEPSGEQDGDHPLPQVVPLPVDAGPDDRRQQQEEPDPLESEDDHRYQQGGGQDGGMHADLPAEGDEGENEAVDEHAKAQDHQFAGSLEKIEKGGSQGRPGQAHQERPLPLLPLLDMQVRDPAGPDLPEDVAPRENGQAKQGNSAPQQELPGPSSHFPDHHHAERRHDHEGTGNGREQKGDPVKPSLHDWDALGTPPKKKTGLGLPGRRGGG